MRYGQFRKHGDLPANWQLVEHAQPKLVGWARFLVGNRTEELINGTCGLSNIVLGLEWVQGNDSPAVLPAGCHQCSIHLLSQPGFITTHDFHPYCNLPKNTLDYEIHCVDIMKLLEPDTPAHMQRNRQMEKSHDYFNFTNYVPKVHGKQNKLRVNWKKFDSTKTLMKFTMTTITKHITKTWMVLFNTYQTCHQNNTCQTYHRDSIYQIYHQDNTKWI